MAQPTPYEPDYDFSAFSSGSPNAQPPGVPLDVEFNNLRITLAQILANLQLIQRDDTRLRNASVGVDQLDSTALSLLASTAFSVGGDWAGSTVYTKGQFVSASGVTYLVMKDHTSTAIATDLTAGNLVIAFDPDQRSRVRDSFVGDAVTTDWALSQEPVRASDIEVFIDGELQLQSVYSTAGTTLTITPARGSTQKIEVFTTFDADMAPLTQEQIVAAVNEAAANAVKGDSAYQIWLNEGNEGTEADFLDAITTLAVLLGTAGAASVGATKAPTVQKAIDVLLGARDATNAAIAAALADGVIVQLGGLRYEVDSTATGTASATNDLSVDGLIPHGDWRPEHFGLNPGIDLPAQTRLVGEGVVDSLITNTAVDQVAVSITGTGTGSANRFDYVKLERFKVAHEAASFYGVVFDNAAYNSSEGLHIDCNSAGLGGLLLGDRNNTPVSQAYQSRHTDLRIDDATEACVRINSTGTQHILINPALRTSVAGAHALDISCEGVQVFGGQIGMSGGGGGVGVRFYNRQAGEQLGGMIDGLSFEQPTASGQYAVVIDGTSPFSGIEINQIRANFAAVGGTLVQFGNARRCVVNNPIIKNPTSGGTLAEWGASSQDCVLRCNFQAATAPIVVSASATRAIKKVFGNVPRTSFYSVTTRVNLTTILEDGLGDCPESWLPVAKGNVWNIAFCNMIADDRSTALVVQSSMGVAHFREDVKIANFGSVVYDCAAATPTAILQNGGSIAVATGQLNGTTGTNATTNFSAGQLLTLAATGADSATVLTVSVSAGPAVFPVNQFVGMTVTNVTDGSTGTVVSNTDSTITVSALTGGSDNTFQAADSCTIAGNFLFVEARNGNVDATIMHEPISYGV